MKKSNQTLLSRDAAFTLIELLVVIAVIGILASLLFPVTKVMKKNRMIAVAKTELAQVETAIEAYKARYGTFPPDNPGNFLINQLYYELEGTVLTNSVYQTLDGSGSMAPAQFVPFYGAGTKVSGFVNFSASAKGSDDKGAAEKFLRELKPTQVGALSSVPPLGLTNKVLICSVLWDQPASYPVPTGVPAGMNPWRYISTSPTNNPGAYDLWVDILIGDKTNRICNWSKTPIQL